MPDDKVTPYKIARRERNFSKTPVGMRAQSERNRAGRKSGETSARQQSEDRMRRVEGKLARDRGFVEAKGGGKVKLIPPASVKASDYTKARKRAS